MPLQATSGAASYDAFGGGVPVVNYIEDMFSTYLFTGNGTSQTITNDIDLSTKGGLAWFKGRNNTNNHALYDTARGTTKRLSTSQTGGTGAQVTDATSLTAFNSNGFSVGSDNSQNENTYTFASWTFRKQPKFFDVVTYTGNSTAGREIPHSLGSVPGMIIVKSTSGSGRNWAVWHRSLGSNNDYLWLESTAAKASSSTYWNNTAPTSTVFTVGSAGNTNENSETYVAYLFAHDAGGFGLTGTDNVISCGSFTTDGSGAASVNLGYEPQWVMQKRTDSSTGGNWYIADNMRGMNVNGSRGLFPNLADTEETTDQGPARINATGFTASRFANATYIYIAIRRGPMKVPTVGTSVFAPIAAVTGTQTTNFPIDMMMQFWRTSNDIYANTQIVDRLRGVSSNATAQSNYLLTTSTGGTDPQGAGNMSKAWSNTGFETSPAYVGGSNIFECFRRAPSFFDEVCYTGDGGYVSRSHNLAAVPEMMIVKARSTTSNWSVYNSALGLGNYVRLNTTAASAGTGDFWYQTPTSTQFSVGGYTEINDTGVTYVAYLFATCAGVSKVGSYTGTGTTLQIDCGFTAGARFVLIKRTNTTGDWYVWDSARGIIAGNDPYLLLNSTAAEVTSTDYIDTYNAGFELSSTAPAAINASGGTFIFLAIA
jgi:hypothetical protein